MKTFATTICLGLGDNLVARIVFDSVKHKYSEIAVSHDRGVLRHYKNGDVAYARFLDEIGHLLFSEAPYRFTNNQYQQIHTFNNIKNCSPIVVPNFHHLICRGTPLDIKEPYICITSKIRAFHRKQFLPLSISMWRALNLLIPKYKIVIMGERELNESQQYRRDLPDHLAYSVYDQIIANLPKDRVVDLTVPSLGLIAPELSKVQQDALILKNAEFAISLGNGGNLWLCIAAAKKVIAFRDDADTAADAILNPNFTFVKMHKNWNNFISELERS